MVSRKRGTGQLSKIGPDVRQPMEGGGGKGKKRGDLEKRLKERKTYRKRGRRPRDQKVRSKLVLDCEGAKRKGRPPPEKLQQKGEEGNG